MYEVVQNLELTRKKAFEVVISTTVSSASKQCTAARYMYMKDIQHILYTSAEVHVHVGYSA